jgi:hypothetical protein
LCWLGCCFFVGFWGSTDSLVPLWLLARAPLLTATTCSWHTPLLMERPCDTDALSARTQLSCTLLVLCGVCLPSFGGSLLPRSSCTQRAQHQGRGRAAFKGNTWYCGTLAVASPLLVQTHGAVALRARPCSHFPKPTSCLCLSVLWEVHPKLQPQPASCNPNAITPMATRAVSLATAWL